MKKQPKDSTLDIAMLALHVLLDYGMEYPDAAVKTALLYDIDVDWIHLTYDKEQAS